MEIWTNIIVPLLLALIPTGGIIGIVTIREKKVELALQNAAKVNEAWEKLSNANASHCDVLQREIEKKEDKLAEKDALIERLHLEKSELMAKLDTANTERALAKTFICDKIACNKRRPPYGQGIDYDFHKPIPLKVAMDEEA